MRTLAVVLLLVTVVAEVYGRRPLRARRHRHIRKHKNRRMMFADLAEEAMNAENAGYCKNAKNALFAEEAARSFMAKNAKYAINAENAEKAKKAQYAVKAHKAYKAKKATYATFARRATNVAGRKKTILTTNGKRCVFPFIYKKKTYRTCTGVNNRGRPWCSTTRIYKGKWGHCKVERPSTTRRPHTHTRKITRTKLAVNVTHAKSMHAKKSKIHAHVKKSKKHAHTTKATKGKKSDEMQDGTYAKYFVMKSCEEQEDRCGKFGNGKKCVTAGGAMNAYVAANALSAKYCLHALKASRASHAGKARYAFNAENAARAAKAMNAERAGYAMYVKMATTATYAEEATFAKHILRNIRVHAHKHSHRRSSKIAAKINRIIRRKAGDEMEENDDDVADITQSIPNDADAVDHYPVDDDDVADITQSIPNDADAVDHYPVDDVLDQIPSPQEKDVVENVVEDYPAPNEGENSPKIGDDMNLVI